MARKAKNARKKTARKQKSKKAVRRTAAVRSRKKKSQGKTSRKPASAWASKPKVNPEEMAKKIQQRVETYIKRLYPKSYEKHEDGRFLIFEGSTVVQTVVRPWHAGDMVVETFAYVVQDANLSEDLLKFLLRENAVIHFGAFGLGFDGTIIFSHSLAAANLDANEFEASVKSVARIADYYDNRIVEMAGGMTAREAMKRGIV